MPLTRDQMTDVKLIVKQTIEELFSDENFIAVISEKIEQKLGLKATQQKIVGLEKQVDDLRRIKSKLECDMDMLNQRIRRKSLRIFGMQEKQDRSVSEQVRAFCEDKLKMHVSEENLENCFWTGKSKNGMRNILFTVDSYNLKMKLLRNRRLLKGSGLTLTEDMTPSRHSLYKKSVQKWGKQSTWFFDGKIWVKIRENKYEIKSDEDINNLH
ncbi:unnamed protein product [Callosobruchus maculatus]|uniref:Uncharacterized protein n=1 Tax=Callosobruchus maculatus TaxID=64391 RepID=A0A653CQ17_CALMS|nr:unnamed protein product [Callosobruchus maculatus]